MTDQPLVERSAGATPAVGDLLEVHVGSIAHGGHCVARHEGRVVFVRHTLPGDRVRARITGIGSKGRYLRADAVEILIAAPARVTPPCPHAGPDLCGGCDFQHVRPVEQRALKSAVVREQLSRLGGVDVEVEVEAVTGDTDGLGWRTRVRFAVDAQGRAGLHPFHSGEVIPLRECPIAAPGVPVAEVLGRQWPGAASVLALTTSTGTRAVLAEPLPDTGRGALDALSADLPPDITVPGVRGRRRVHEVAAGRDWQVAADGFWQVHPGAADALVAAVREAAGCRIGDHVVDLYAGVGLLGGALADEVGPGGRIDLVESDPEAIASARRNLHDLPWVRLSEAGVQDWLRGRTQPRAPHRADIVILDPPRAGAGARVLADVVRLRPRRIVLVACDPAALGRDVGILRGAGWALGGVRAFDIFPMTHHVECVAWFVQAR